MDLAILESQDTKVTYIHKISFLLSPSPLPFLPLIFSYGKANHNQRQHFEYRALENCVRCIRYLQSSHQNILLTHVGCLQLSCNNQESRSQSQTALGYSRSVFALLIFLLLNFHSRRIFLAMHTFFNYAYEVNKPRNHLFKVILHICILCPQVLLLLLRAWRIILFFSLRILSWHFPAATGS